MESLTLAVRLATADSVDTGEIAAVAAQTFPLACPPSTAPENMTSFVAANLSAERFAEYLADPRRAVLVAATNGRIIGYAMVIRELPGETAELSKMYVLPDYHGAGASAALMDRTLAVAADWGVCAVWLGVNQQNQRAQRFYTKNGFTVEGTRTFQVGSRLEHDYVMVRRLRP